MRSRNNQRRKKYIGFLLVFIILLILGIKSPEIVGKIRAIFPGEMVIPVVTLSDQDRFKMLLGEKGIVVSGLDWGERQITATVSGNLIVLFLNNDKLVSQVTSLQFILSRSKIEGKSPRRVDLRFDKPVLTY